jgi:hypothetical protein
VEEHNGQGSAWGALVLIGNLGLKAAMAVRRYARDRRGRFASGGGGGTIANRSKPAPPARSGGSMTKALRRGQRALYRAEQDRIQVLGGNVAGMRIIQRDIRRGAAARSSAAPASTGGTGRVSDAMRSTLRGLAQSDARYYRELGNILGSTGGGQKRVTGSRKPRRRLPGS